jgi:hypothetical protein
LVLVEFFYDGVCASTTWYIYIYTLYLLLLRWHHGPMRTFSSLSLFYSTNWIYTAASSFPGCYVLSVGIQLLTFEGNEKRSTSGFLVMSLSKTLVIFFVLYSAERVEIWSWMVGMLESLPRSYFITRLIIFHGNCFNLRGDLSYHGPC